MLREILKNKFKSFNVQRSAFRVQHSAFSVQRPTFSVQKGISIYFAILIMTILMGVALALTTISFLQIRLIRGMGNSVVAFYAADTGIAKTLYDDRQGTDILTTCTPSSPCQDTLDNGASYKVIALSPGEEDCPSDTTNYCVKSIGSYKGDRRAIRIRR